MVWHQSLVTFVPEDGRDRYEFLPLLSPTIIRQPSPNGFIAPFHGARAHGNLQFNLTNFNYRTGVFVKLDLTAYRGDEGPFKLSLYEAPVSDDGKCDGAKNIPDPFQRGDKLECDRKSPQTCQVGDPVGKYGEIPKFQGVISIKQSFQGLYFKKEEREFIGNRSMILENARRDKTACANITEVYGTAKTWGPKGTGTQPKSKEGPRHGPGFGPGSASPPWKPSPGDGPPGLPPSMIGHPFAP
ncbi:unnamed protein product [Tuber aestivum]|uniref:Superoxide dismutase copper/zinc binding domain-containing protein n=1 Tax=Tuber aestivum TaxID=59557 RepID=A0A292PMY3_9PEZI|nr:unnamed protein product [Tuber aestivum]